MSYEIQSTSSHLPEETANDDAFQWGLGSLIIAAVLVIASPATLILAAQVWAVSDHGKAVVHLHAWLARIGIALVLVLAATNLVFATMAVRSAKKFKRPFGVSCSALLLGILAAALWVITAIAFLNTTESLLRIYG